MQRYTGILAALLLLSGCVSYYDGPISDHYDGSQFYNYYQPKDVPVGKVLWHIMTSPEREWPEYFEPEYDKPPTRVNGSELRISYVGHATVLIQTQGLNIITDPTWSHRASPVTWIGPKRVVAPGIRWQNLPPIDCVLISHNHYDHLDIPTLTKLVKRDNPVIYAPLGNDTIIHKHLPNANVIALDWEQQHQYSSKLEVVSQPAHHWSTRMGPFDHNKALWGAFVLKLPDGNIYFGGDSGYSDGYYHKNTGRRFGPFRLALIGIGTYQPRWLVRYVHHDPFEAVKIHQHLHAQHSLGIHFGTFDLSSTPYSQPPELLESAKRSFEIPADSFKALQVGQSWNIPALKSTGTL